MRSQLTSRSLVRDAGLQAGRLSREQLDWLGWSVHQLDGRVKAGILTPALHGVYAVGPRLTSRLATAWEAVLAVGGDGALDGAWGCWQHGLLADPPGIPLVSTASQRGRAIEGVEVHRHRWIVETDVRVIDGMRVMAPRWCLLGLARRHPRLLGRALNEAQRRLVDVGDLRSFAKGRRGGPALVAALDAYDPREERTREELERLALKMLVDRGAPVYEPNARVMTDVREHEVDGLYREQGVVIELQSEAHHATPAERRADRVKANALTRAGLKLVQWDWHDVTRVPDATVAALLPLLDPR